MRGRSDLSELYLEEYDWAESYKRAIAFNDLLLSFQQSFPQNC